MTKIANKLLDLEYNELIALKIIEEDNDLDKIFREDTSLSYPMLYTLIKENTLDTTTKSSINEIFEYVILTKKELLEKYYKILKNQTSANEGLDVNVIEENNKENNQEQILPRRYGKNKILRDIETNGGKATPLQNAMLKVNELKNLYVILAERGKKDMLTGSNLLSDADCRDIVSVVTLAQRKLNSIIKRKK